MRIGAQGLETILPSCSSKELRGLCREKEPKQSIKINSARLVTTDGVIDVIGAKTFQSNTQVPAAGHRIGLRRSREV